MADAGRSAGEEPVRVWRVSVAGRLGAVIAALVIIGVGAALPLSLAEEGMTLQALDFVVAGIVMAVAVPVLVSAFRPRVVLTPESLLVVNPLQRSRCRLDEITDIQPGWAGLGIELADGDSITAWAVQKTNLARWLSLPGRSERIATEIRRAAGL